MLKLLHCADFHLDIPFSAKNSTSSLRRQQLRDTFSHMVDIAMDKEVDLVLIAGDLFERSFISHKTASLILFELERLNGHCKVVIAPGNHDPYQKDSPYAKLPFPDNVYLFTQEQITSFAFPELRTRVFGYAFCDISHPDAPLQGFSVTESDAFDFSLLCAHTEFGSVSTTKAPISAKDLEQSGLDYAAFGHIHSRTEPQRIGKTTYAYCGSADGLDFGELGKKSLYYVELEKVEDKTQIRVETIPTSPRHYEILTVNVRGAKHCADTIPAILEAIQKAGYDENTAVRILLQGEVDSSFDFSQQQILAQLPPLLFAQVKNETVPFLDRQSLESDIGIQGAFYRALLPQLESDDVQTRTTAALALQYGLCALRGEEFSVTDSDELGGVL